MIHKALERGPAAAPVTKSSAPSAAPARSGQAAVPGQAAVASLTLPPGGGLEAAQAVMGAVDGLSVGPDGRVRTTYRGQVLALTPQQAEQVRASARDALARALGRSRRRGDDAIGRYRAQEQVNADFPVTSGAVKAWAYVRSLGDYANPGEAIRGLQVTVEQEGAEATKAVEAGSLAAAAGHLARVDAASERMAKLVRAYVEQLIEGGESLATGLEYTRDAAFITLGILAVVVSGGAAAGVAPGVIGTGVAGLSVGGTATAISVGAPILANVGTGAVQTAYGDRVDWGSIAVDAAVQVVLARLGGKLGESLFGRLAGNPASQTLARKAIAALVSGVATHEVSQAFSVTVHQAYDALRGRDVTWGGFVGHLGRLRRRTGTSAERSRGPVHGRGDERRAARSPRRGGPRHRGEGAATPSPEAGTTQAGTTHRRKATRAGNHVKARGAEARAGAGGAEARAGAGGGEARAGAGGGQACAGAGGRDARTGAGDRDARAGAGGGQARAGTRGAGVRSRARGGEASPRARSGARAQGGGGEACAHRRRASCWPARGGASQAPSGAAGRAGTTGSPGRPPPRLDEPVQDRRGSHRARADQQERRLHGGAGTRGGERAPELGTRAHPGQIQAAGSAAVRTGQADLRARAGGRPGERPADRRDRRAAPAGPPHRHRGRLGRPGRAQAGGARPARSSPGHLLANVLGGSGTDRGNLAWMHKRINNSSYKTEFENHVIRALRSGQAVRFGVRPLFRPGEAAPYAVEVWATGGNGQAIVPVRTILTPGLSDVPVPGE